MLPALDSTAPFDISWQALGPRCRTGITPGLRAEGRITAVGALPRKTGLQALPHWFPMPRGESSPAGPRPHGVGEALIAPCRQRHRLRRGMTGWARIPGPRAPRTEDQPRRRVAPDPYDIDHWSLWLELKTPLPTALGSPGGKTAL